MAIHEILSKIKNRLPANKSTKLQNEHYGSKLTRDSDDPCDVYNVDKPDSGEIAVACTWHIVYKHPNLRAAKNRRKETNYSNSILEILLMIKGSSLPTLKPKNGNKIHNWHSFTFALHLRIITTDEEDI